MSNFDDSIQEFSAEPGQLQVEDHPTLEQANAQMQRFLAEQAEMRRNAALGYAATVQHETIDDLIEGAQRVYNYLLSGDKGVDEI